MANHAPEAQVEPKFVNYWGTGEEKRVMLPDGVQSFTIRKLNEGQRKSYFDAATVEQVEQRGSNQVKTNFKAGTERFQLLKLAICDFKIFNEHGDQIPFSTAALERVLDAFPPDIIDIVYDEIRKMNKWLMGQASIEDVEKEIERLQERLAYLKEEEAKKAG